MTVRFVLLLNAVAGCAGWWFLIFCSFTKSRLQDKTDWHMWRVEGRRRLFAFPLFQFGTFWHVAVQVNLLFFFLSPVLICRCLQSFEETSNRAVSFVFLNSCPAVLVWNSGRLTALSAASSYLSQLLWRKSARYKPLKLPICVRLCIIMSACSRSAVAPSPIQSATQHWWASKTPDASLFPSSCLTQGGK